jgi:hypothetical protein
MKCERNGALPVAHVAHIRLDGLLDASLTSCRAARSASCISPSSMAVCISSLLYSLGCYENFRFQRAEVLPEVTPQFRECG